MSSKLHLNILFCFSIISLIASNTVWSLQDDLNATIQKIICNSDATSESSFADEFAEKFHEEIVKDPELAFKLGKLLQEETKPILKRRRRGFTPSGGIGLSGIISEPSSNNVVNSKKEINLDVLKSQVSHEELSPEKRKRFYESVSRIKSQSNQGFMGWFYSKRKTLPTLEISREMAIAIIGKIHRFYDKNSYIFYSISSRFLSMERKFPVLYSFMKNLFEVTRPTKSFNNIIEGADILGSGEEHSVASNEVNFPSIESKNKSIEKFQVNKIFSEMGKQAIYLTAGLIAEFMFKSEDGDSVCEKFLTEIKNKLTTYLIVELGHKVFFGGECKRNKT